jgi:hypothetical protein
MLQGLRNTWRRSQDVKAAIRQAKKNVQQNAQAREREVKKNTFRKMKEMALEKERVAIDQLKRKAVEDVLAMGRKRVTKLEADIAYMKNKTKKTVNAYTKATL